MTDSSLSHEPTGDKNASRQVTQHTSITVELENGQTFSFNDSAKGIEKLLNLLEESCPEFWMGISAYR